MKLKVVAALLLVALFAVPVGSAETAYSPAWVEANYGGGTAPSDAVAQGSSYGCAITQDGEFFNRTAAGEWTFVSTPNSALRATEGLYAVGNGGIIYEQTSGCSFSSVTSPTGNALIDVSENGYAVGASSVILERTGGTWTQVYIGSFGTTLRAVSSAGYAVGDNGLLLERDGGGSWNIVPVGTTVQLSDVSGGGYAVGREQTILERDANGAWLPAQIGPNLQSVYDAFNDLGLGGPDWDAVDDDGLGNALVTDGALWAERTDGVWELTSGPINVNEISFVSSTQIYAFGSEDVIDAEGDIYENLVGFSEVNDEFPETDVDFDERVQTRFWPADTDGMWVVDTSTRLCMLSDGVYDQNPTLRKPDLTEETLQFDSEICTVLEFTQVGRYVLTFTFDPEGLAPADEYVIQWQVHQAPSASVFPDELSVNITDAPTDFSVNITDAPEQPAFPDEITITESTTAVGGTSTWNILIIILMAAVGVFVWAKTEPLPLRFGGTILVCVAGLMAFEFAAALYIMVPLGLTLLALGAYGFYEIPQSQKMKKDEFDIGSL